jgi:tRNA(fMet)-specific endonuclease VapC
VIPMEYLLDTDTCIFCQRYRPPEVRQRLEEVGLDAVNLSVITAFELRYGAEKHPSPIKARGNLRVFLFPFRVLPWTDQCATEAARIRAVLEKRGASIGGYDLLIAAHAKFLGLTLVTNNVREFNRVDGLKVENWCPPRN